MNSQTDQELLREYATDGSEAAFAEVVRRYVDLVYSAARRLVGNPCLAEDVSQSVFLALAQNARRLADRTVLSGWLHGTTHNLSANAVRAEMRRRAREQEAAAMNESLAPEPEATWESVAPHLDAALNHLSGSDRDAVLLRYFQRKSAAEIAQILGISAEAAQKRVARAVVRLREFFAKRGLAVGTSGLMALISANAVQAAPVTLAVTISSAAISGASVHASIVTTATKILSMTTLQKTIVTAAVVAALTTGIYKTNQVLHRRSQATAPKQSGQAGKSDPSQPAADASAGATSPAGPAAPSRSARPKSSPAPGGFTASEMYALMTNKVSRLTLAQVAPYLSAKGRNASSLLAAYRTTGEPTLLAEAIRNFPNDPHVGFEASIRNNASATERRAGLDSFKRAATENSMANYLSALDYFKTGHKDDAIRELNAAAAKPIFNDYGPERTSTDEAAYLAAGYQVGEAQFIANAFLIEPQLSQVREVGQKLVDLAGGYAQAGDESSRELALQMALQLGRRIDDPSSGQSMRWQLIGIRVERAALNAMDPSRSLEGTGQSVRDRLAQIAAQMESMQSLTKQADPIWKTLSDQDWTEFHARMAATGEEGAVRWLVSNHAQR